MATIRVWLFDIDGTLINSGGAGSTATFHAVSSVFQREIRTEGIQFAGRTDRAIVADLFRLNGIPDEETSWLRFREAYLAALRLSLATRPGKVLEGVAQLLQQLQGTSGHYLGLLTGNMRHGAQAKLSHYQLWDRFGFGGFGDNHKSRDDVAALALHDAQRRVPHAFTTSDVWVVGDTVADIQCARAIGANVIAVATGGATYEQLQAAQPDRLVRVLSETDALAELIG